MSTLHGAKIYVIYGFSEGPKLAGRLRNELAKRGGELVSSPSKADVVITHSGGCFLLPRNLVNKTVLIVNPVCGSLAKLPFVIAIKVWWDFLEFTRQGQFINWLRKTSWNLWYMLTRVDRNIRMLKQAPRYQKRLPNVTAKHVAVINNAHDPWAREVPHAEVARLGYLYITLPGPHDDLWLNPAKYLDILEY